jgi:hypothetical protein
MADNGLGTDGFGRHLLAGGGDHLLAMFSHNSVYYLIKLLVANIPWDLDLPRHTGGLGNTLAFWL